MARQTRRFVPRLEAFDERALPSVTITEFSDGTLQILGDDSANSIVISDTGDPVSGSVTVQADGQLYVSQGIVTRIQVFTYGGDDTVDYWLSSDLTCHRTVAVDLGAGNDAFTAHLDGQTFCDRTDFLVQVFGGGGKDTLRMDAQGVIIGAGNFTVDFEGGHGKDGVLFNYSPASVDPNAWVNLTSDQRVR